MDKIINLTLSNDIFDRQEDVYSFVEFGTFVNRFSITEQIVSSKFWKYLKTKYKVDKHNIKVNCDIQKDIKVCFLHQYILTKRPYLHQEVE